MKRSLWITTAVAVLAHLLLGWYFVVAFVIPAINTENESVEVFVPPPPPPPPEKPRVRPRFPPPIPPPPDVPPLPIPPQPPAPDTTDATTTTSDQTVPPPAPKPTKRVLPTMPEKAQEREREGSATVYVTIAGDGSVSDVVIAAESPEGYGFGAAAKSAVLKWQFAPGQPGKYNVTIRFKLGG